MAKSKEKKVDRKEELRKSNEFNKLKSLRKDKIISRELFHALCYHKGVNQHKEKHRMPMESVFCEVDDKNAVSGKSLKLVRRAVARFD